MALLLHQFRLGVIGGSLVAAEAAEVALLSRSPMNSCSFVCCFGCYVGTEHWSGFWWA